jgi:hypothetical protein
VRGAITALAVLCFYAFFYRRVVAHWGPVMRWSLAWLRLAARRPMREVEATEKLLAAGIAQLLLAVVLLVGAGVGPADLVGPGIEPVILAAAIGLGFAELALTSLLCATTLEFATLMRGDWRTAEEWEAESRGGWMSYFLLTARAAPSALAFASIALYVVMEEVIFRGILIEALAPAGMSVAIGVSAVLFVTVQAFAMPSRRAALFPMVGAAVVGPVHGIIFWHVRDVLPLALAHLAYFAAALSFTRGRRELTI